MLLLLFLIEFAVLLTCSINSLTHSALEKEHNNLLSLALIGTNKSLL